MTARPLARLVPAALLALALAGCGLTDPYQSNTAATPPAASRTTASPSDRRDPAPERGGTIPASAQATQKHLVVGAARPTPRAALERYAAAYLNWNSANVVQRQRELASISLGQARAQALQAAASASRDPELASGRIANHGEVIAISRGQGAAAGKWVIVTSEQTSGQDDYEGLPPTLHIIYAQLTDTRAGWVLSGWQPLN
jgi:hypothetical protein